jgi:c-di-GMP-binding flagellar brake protein YcgR
MTHLRHVRVPTPPIQVRIASAFGQLVNISATGALAHVRHALPEREWPMVIYVDPQPVELRVRVVRSTAVSIFLPGASVMKSEECAVALEFTDLSPTAQEVVTRLCGRASDQQE